MQERVKKIIIDAVKHQQDIFGDILYDKVELTAPESEPNTEQESLSINLKPEENKETVQRASNPDMTSDKNLFQEDWEKSDSLDELYEKIHTCVKCPLGKTRNNFVFGVGNPNADAMIIGEAPGADEDAKGEPFVGRAGKLLNDILKAINFEREEVYIANIIKCRPPGNRNPLPAEMDTCSPYLYKQIELIKPKIILCLGLVAASTMLKSKLSLTKMRGSVYEISGIKAMVTYHPAALLRNPNWKRGCWEDVQKFRKLYDELTG